MYSSGFGGALSSHGHTTVKPQLGSFHTLRVWFLSTASPLKWLCSCSFSFHDLNLLWIQIWFMFYDMVCSSLCCSIQVIQILSWIVVCSDSCTTFFTAAVAIGGALGFKNANILLVANFRLLGILIICMIDIGLIGLKRVTIACCLAAACRELLVLGLLCADGWFIHQIADLGLIRIHHWRTVGRPSLGGVQTTQRRRASKYHGKAGLSSLLWEPNILFHRNGPDCRRGRIMKIKEEAF
ncbi:transmembrane protein, putative [Medicago truncatula]|uniref:Transmembrane protein, putative n=1 Tax=Medicago truncatula TaxID=3880 RepID=G7KCJ6_MEDTR|nr:transmembrane protein, putative [Medicago truncatula]